MVGLILIVTVMVVFDLAALFLAAGNGRSTSEEPPRSI